MSLITDRSALNGRKGFTLVEIVIVAAIIVLLAVIAIPNFIRAGTTARKNACIANLKQLQRAIQTWAIDTSASSTATFTTADIVGNYLQKWPKEGTLEYPIPANVSATPVCPNSAANTDHTL